MTPPRNELEPPRDTCDASSAGTRCWTDRSSDTTSFFDRTAGQRRRATYGYCVDAAMVRYMESVYVKSHTSVPHVLNRCFEVLSTNTYVHGRNSHDISQSRLYCLLLRLLYAQ